MHAHTNTQPHKTHVHKHTLAVAMRRSPICVLGTGQLASEGQFEQSWSADTSSCSVAFHRDTPLATHSSRLKVGGKRHDRSIIDEQIQLGV